MLQLDERTKVTKVHQFSTDVWLTFKVGGRLYKKTSL